MYELGKYEWQTLDMKYLTNMTREEEKREAARRYATHDVDTDETDFYGNYVKKEDFVLREYNAFIEGCKWSDKNPKYHWISVDDDLPCNHEELLHPLYANFTKDVLVIFENKYISLERMIKDDKGNWKFVGNVLYWMPIPELSKE